MQTMQSSRLPPVMKLLKKPIVNKLALIQPPDFIVCHHKTLKQILKTMLRISAIISTSLAVLHRTLKLCSKIFTNEPADYLTFLQICVN